MLTKCAYYSNIITYYSNNVLEKNKVNNYINSSDCLVPKGFCLLFRKTVQKDSFNRLHQSVKLHVAPHDSIFSETKKVHLSVAMPAYFVNP